MTDTRKSIWCLFSVEDNYDQPANNLVRWWAEKPSIEALAAFLAMPMDKASNEDIVAVVDVWKGATARIWNTDYRLQEVREGEAP